MNREVEYNISATEVLYIIKYLPENLVEKIPDKFINFLKEHSIDGYNPNFNFSQGLDKVELKEKTRALLAMIYRKYICSEEERLEYDKILAKNEEIYQDNLRKNCDFSDIFKKHEIEIKEEVKEEKNEIVKYKETIWNKIINRINKLCKLKK